ncbi:MAG: hypothetical protein KME16_13570 [Scytolyngbya sp. HA4215-MV1]|nr:hypothetical protein [Scytolyngbya sp. HA4215-MV1]
MSLLFNEKDRLAIPKALAEKSNQIKNEWSSNSASLEQIDQNLQALISQRDAVKIKLESRYGVALE